MLLYIVRQRNIFSKAYSYNLSSSCALQKKKQDACSLSLFTFTMEPKYAYTAM